MKKVLILFLVLMGLIGCGLDVNAASKTWDGGDATRSSWSVITNWDLDTAPVDMDDLIFSGVNRLSNTNDFPSDTLFNSITFSANAGAFNLYGNSLVISNGITNFSTSPQTIHLDISFITNSIINSASNSIWIAGNITNSSWTNVIVKIGTNLLTFAGTNYSAGLICREDTTVFNTGSVWNTIGQFLNPGIVVSASNGTTATLFLNNATITNASTNGFVGAIIAGYNESNVGGTGRVIQVGGNVNISSIMRFGVNTNTAYGSYVVSNGFITLSSTDPLQIQNGCFIQIRDGYGSFYQKNSTVTVDRAGNGSRTYPDPTSAGLVLGFNNGSRGDFTVDGGLLQVTNRYATNGLAYSIAVGSGQNASTSRSGPIFFTVTNNGVVNARRVTLCGYCNMTSTFNMASGIFRVDDLMKGTNFNPYSNTTSTNSTAIFNWSGGTISPMSTNLTIGRSLSNMNVSGNCTFDTTDMLGSQWPIVVSNNLIGTGSITKNGTETLYLSNTNTFTGSITLNQGTLSVTLSNAYPSNVVLYMASGTTNNLNFIGTNYVTYFYINNVPQPAGTYGTNIVSHTNATYFSGNGILNVNLLGPRTMSLNKTWDGGDAINSLWTSGTNWDLDTVPVAMDNLIFSGTTRLSNTNGYSANTIFQNITFSSGAGAFNIYGNSIIISNGITNLSLSTQTIYLNTLFITNSIINCASGSMTVAGNVILTNNNTLILNTDNALTQTIQGVISGSGALTKTGSGRLVLANTNIYNGANIVNQGTVILNSNNSSMGSIIIATGSTFNILGKIYNAGYTNPPGWTNAYIFTNLITYTNTIVNNGALIFNSSTSTQCLLGVMSGGGNFIYSNSIPITLSGTNTFYGRTIIASNRTLLASEIDSIGSSGVIDLYENSTMLLIGDATTYQKNQTINLAGNGGTNFFINQTNDVTLSLNGPIITTGTGAKTLVLQLGKDNISGDRATINLNNSILEQDNSSPLSIQIKFGHRPTNSNPSSYYIIPADWIQGVWYVGVMSLVNTTTSLRFYDYIVNRGTTLNWMTGQYYGYPTNYMYHADNHVAPRAWIMSYITNPVPAKIAPIQTSFDYVLAHPDTNAFVPFSNGSKRWRWCDALFMAPATWSLMSTATGDMKYRNFATSEWWKCSAALYEGVTNHLYFRDSTYFSLKEPNGQPKFWSRGEGWVMGGLAQIIQTLPSNEPTLPLFTNQLSQMGTKVLSILPSDGLWHPSMLDPVSYPQTEESGSALMLYGLAFAVNNGIMTNSLIPQLMQIWTNLMGCVTAEGMVRKCQPAGADPQNLDENTTQPYGVGGFLLAGSEIYKMAQPADRPGIIEIMERVADWEIANEMPYMGRFNINSINTFSGSLTMNETTTNGLGIVNVNTRDALKNCSSIYLTNRIAKTMMVLNTHDILNPNMSFNVSSSFQGIINLAPNTINYVKTFAIDGTNRLSGTWGATNSIALNKSNIFTNTGLLMVGSSTMDKIPLEKNRLFESNKLSQ